MVRLINSGTAQDSPTISVAGIVEAGILDSPIVVTDMVKTGDTLLSVAQGYDPMKTWVGNFTVKSIEQSTPLVNVYNTLTVTLVTDVDLAVGTIVTLTGLASTAHGDDAALAVASTSSAFGTAGVWTQANGTLVLTVDAVTTGGTSYQVTFTLLNPGSAQSAPEITIAATIEAGDLDSPITAAAMAQPGSSLLAVPLSKNPLEIFLPVFVTQTIGQTNPLIHASNTLYATLVPYQDMAAGSNVTITGLTGTQTADNSSILVSSAPSNFRSTGEWTQSSGTVVVFVDTMLDKDATYIVSFEVQNSATAQDAVVATISGYVEAEGILDSDIAPSNMANGIQDMINVTNGSHTLYTIVPLFTATTIIQVLAEFVKTDKPMFLSYYLLWG